MSWAQYVKDGTYTSHVVGFNLPWLDSPSYPFTAGFFSPWYEANEHAIVLAIHR